MAAPKTPSFLQWLTAVIGDARLMEIAAEVAPRIPAAESGRRLLVIEAKRSEPALVSLTVQSPGCSMSATGPAQRALLMILAGDGAEPEHAVTFVTPSPPAHTFETPAGGLAMFFIVDARHWKTVKGGPAGAEKAPPGPAPPPGPPAGPAQ